MSNYRDFNNDDEFYNEGIKKHGHVIKTKKFGEYYTIIAWYNRRVTLIEYPLQKLFTCFSYLLEKYVWADDGSPIGVEVPDNV